MHEIIQMVMFETKEILDADQVSLYIYSKEKKHLYTVETEAENKIASIQSSLVGACYTSRALINITDAYAGPFKI